MLQTPHQLLALGSRYWVPDQLRKPAQRGHQHQKWRCIWCPLTGIGTPPPETAHCYGKRIGCVVTEDGASNIAALEPQGSGCCRLILLRYHKTGVTPNLQSLSFIVPSDSSTLGKNSHLGPDRLDLPVSPRNVSSSNPTDLRILTHGLNKNLVAWLHTGHCLGRKGRLQQIRGTTL